LAPSLSITTLRTMLALPSSQVSVALRPEWTASFHTWNSSLKRILAADDLDGVPAYPYVDYTIALFG
jgi:hypothetical protein